MADYDPYATPALEPPPGITSNFVNPVTQMGTVIAANTVILAIVTIFVALRTLTKLCIMREFHLEDYFCLLAWGQLVAYVACFLKLEAIGFSRNQWDVNLVMLPDILYWVNVLYVLYGPCTAMAKLSALFQIKRIFTTKTKDAFYYIIWASIGVNIAFYIAVFFYFLFQCVPREAIWNLDVPGTCINGVAGDFAAGIGNLLSDIEALLLPAWAVWHLKTRVKIKVSIFAVFAVGAIAVAIGSVGMWLRVVLLTDLNFTWTGTKLAILVVAEIGIVIIVACMPVLPRLYRWLKHKRQGLTTTQIYGSGVVNQRRLIPSTFSRYGRKKPKLDLGTDILVTQTNEFARCSSDEGDIEMKKGLKQGNYQAHISAYEASQTHAV